ncbi:hypothetical protein MPC4_90001 [Methylocella tundrae]|uniref:Uncharacterized protein n=1 Tax=Methylocella tundrae TaxID=227605 RepID=A0A8B6MDE1_METTU|nr:hypothetical protein MPC4_90001 [Methylocella tundrae]
MPAKIRLKRWVLKEQSHYAAHGSNVSRRQFLLKKLYVAIGNSKRKMRLGKIILAKRAKARAKPAPSVVRIDDD